MCNFRSSYEALILTLLSKLREVMGGSSSNPVLYYSFYCGSAPNDTKLSIF